MELTPQERQKAVHYIATNASDGLLLNLLNQTREEMTTLTSLKVGLKLVFMPAPPASELSVSEPTAFEIGDPPPDRPVPKRKGRPPKCLGDHSE